MLCPDAQLRLKDLKSLLQNDFIRGGAGADSKGGLSLGL